MKWIRLIDELPKHGQKIDLWLVPDNVEKSRRFSWSWEKQDTAAITINGCKATHWIDVGEPSESETNNDTQQINNEALLGSALDIERRKLLIAFVRYIKGNQLYLADGHESEVVDLFIKSN